MLYSTIIGIDTHAKKNEMYAIDRNTGSIETATLSGDHQEVVRWIKGQRFAEPIQASYESGPTGFGLARALIAAGIACTVVATSKLPKRNDRKKNDRVDARWLARETYANNVSAVRIPSVHEESLRNLSRLRGEAAKELAKAKQRVGSFLLLTNTVFTQGKKRWTKKFRTWANSYEFSEETDTFVFRDKLAEVYRLEERLAGIEAKIYQAIEAHPELTELMRRFVCLHNVGKVTAFSLVCEVNDFKRFKNASSFAAYMGLVPSENSTGDKTSRGSITKCGNSHLRRILIEAAQGYSRSAQVTKSADETVDPLVRAHAFKGSRRLKKRREALRARNKQANKAKVAVARELAEWIYHIAVM
jgi:transposase